MAEQLITVYARLRPHKASDGIYLDNGIVVKGPCVTVNNSAKGATHEFRLNGCFGARSTQEDVFKVVQPLVDRALHGENATLFAYGVTGSGKTMTMQGTAQEPGIIPRVARYTLDKAATSSQERVEIVFSYLEILKDELYDLLAGRNNNGTGTKLDIRRDEEGNNVVVGLTCLPVSSFAEFRAVYNETSKLRKTASTKLNSNSSRSHAILTFHVRSYDRAGNLIKEGSIRLCDLAGSENNNLTENDAERLRESAAINKSLTVLGYVIEAINKNAPVVPYRDSKLTRVLEDALRGRSLGMLICCLAPGVKFVKEAINSLNFATRARQIVTRSIPPPVGVAPFRNPSDRRASAPGIRSGSRLSEGPLTMKADGNRRIVRAYRQSLPAARRVTAKGDAAGNSNKENLATSVAPLKPEPGLTEEQVKVLFNDWYEERESKERQTQNSPPAVNVSAAQQNVEAKEEGASLRPHLRQPPKPMDAAQIALLSQDVKDQRGQQLIRLGRKYEQSGDKLNALDCYSHARLYVPHKSKLVDRITELQLYIDGEEGICPHASTERNVFHDGIHSSGIKRSRGFRGDSLATLSQDVEGDAMDGEHEARRVRSRYEGLAEAEEAPRDS